MPWGKLAVQTLGTLDQAYNLPEQALSMGPCCLSLFCQVLWGKAGKLYKSVAPLTKVAGQSLKQLARQIYYVIGAPAFTAYLLMAACGIIRSCEGHP